MAKIIIVEDDERLTEFMERRLLQAGHECACETNGKRALARLEQEPADLIVLDVMLPGASGFEICRRVRSNANWYTVPIIFISAMNSQEEVDHGLGQGADDFLTKPFSMDVLMGRVESLLAAKTQGRLVDELTTLPAAASMKLRIQSMINRRKTFSVIYIELLGIREFGDAVGNEGRARAVRHFARVLHQCGTRLDSKHFRIGHMGGGHFVALMEPEHAKKYCGTALKAWEQYLPKLFADHKQDNLLEQGRRSNPKTLPMLDALFCSTQHTANNSMSSRELFKVLSRLRAKSLDGENSGRVFMDRRG